MVSPRPLKMLRWNGGKSLGGTGTGLWIAQHLPYDPKGLYAEPCGGQLSVMLNRLPVRQEIANDRSGDVVNFYLAMRDRPYEFRRKLNLTPKSEVLHRLAQEAVEANPMRPDVDRAVAWAGLVMNAVAIGGPFVPYKGGANTLTGDWRRGFDDDVHRVAMRLRDVQILNRDAVPLLESLADKENAVIYVDPQYPGTAGDTMYTETVDIDALKAVLPALKGRVAVSGYGDTFDDLVGWERIERETFTSANAGPTASKRVEVLWMNYMLGERYETHPGIQEPLL